MRASDYSDLHRSDLSKRLDAARAAREAEALRARELAADLPPAGEDDDDMRLWNKAGYYAGIACLWALFLAPILLLLSVWD